MPRGVRELIWSTAMQIPISYNDSALCEKCPYSELFWSASLRIQSECGKMWTRITPNTDIFLRRPRCLKWFLQVFEILERVDWFSNLVFNPIFLRNFFVQFFRNFIDCNVRNSHDWVFQNVTYTVKKMKFSIKDFSSKYEGNCIFVQFFCLFFFNWDSPHAKLSSHYEAWSYKKRSTKRITGYRKSV